jgi:tetratricopeptide (TPR) repeat protein
LVRVGSTPALREQVPKALHNRGVALEELGRFEDAVAAYDYIISHYRDDPTPALREQVAKALYNRGVALEELVASRTRLLPDLQNCPLSASAAARRWFAP